MSDINKGDVQKKRRRPHTRASKACTFCRQQKTRCLRSGSSVACLRCISLNLKCSLTEEVDSDIHKQSPTSPFLSSPQKMQTQPVSQHSSHEQQQLPPQQVNVPPNLAQSQLRAINSFMPSKSSSPQPQIQSNIQPNSYEFSPQMLPSINSPITNMLYDRFQPSNQQFQQRYVPTTASNNRGNGITQSHEMIPQLFPHVPLSTSPPRLSQTFIPPSPIPTFNADLETESKIDTIYANVKQILNELGSNPRNQGYSPGVNSSVLTEALPIMKEPVNTTNIATQHHLLSPINFMKLITEQENNDDSNNDSLTQNNSADITKPSPSNLLEKQQQTESFSLPLSILQQLYPLHTFRPHYQDVISTNIITVDQAIQLLDIFRDRYGRWLSFPTMTSTKRLLKRFRNRCPLLLTVSCLLSLKYGDPLLKQKIWSKLCSIVRKEVHWLSSSYSGGLEELQCLVILGAYCIGLSDSSFQAAEESHTNTDDEEKKISNDGEPLLLLDGWHLSGIGLTLFEKLNGYGILDQMYGDEIEILWQNNKRKIEAKLGKQVEPPLHDGDTPTDKIHLHEHEEEEEDDDDEFNLLTLHRIWNTLVLIQLAYCLLDGRKAWVGIEKLKPRQVSNIPSATNFDFRIISEIHMYLIGYRYIMLNETYDKANKDIKLWLDKWGSTFGQPSNQFVEIDYHFVGVLIKIKQLKLDVSSLDFLHPTSETGMKDVIDIKMHAHSIINLIDTVSDDSYFAFLSDQIHLTVFYATNILICILSAMEKLKHNAEESEVETNQHSVLDKEIIKKVEKLIFRYRTVAATKNDTFYKYYNILHNMFTTKLRNQ